MDHTPLSLSTFSPHGQRALQSGQTRLLAARGLVPIANPGELLSVLYQLAGDDTPEVAEAARNSAQTLPDAVRAGGLSDRALDPRVLDFFAGLVRSRPDLLQIIILNPAVADDTLADLAGTGDAALVDLIAQNEQRLLQAPNILTAIYHNRRARMSTVDRVVELAVRNEVKVTGIAEWDALVTAVTGQIARGEVQSAEDIAAVDASFARAAARADGDDDDDADADKSKDEKDKDIPLGKMTVPQKIRRANLGNAFDRALLIRDSNRMVALATIKSPRIKDSEAVRYAGNHSLSDDVIKYIGSRRDWTKSYGVKLALVLNPKTSIPDAIRFIAHLRERDLRTVARSRGVPSAVTAQARKQLQNRR